MLKQFKNKHEGKRICIVGKGPSLDNIGMFSWVLEGCPVICLNESIHKIESLNTFPPAGPLYVVQQDSHLGNRCRPSRGETIWFLSMYQPVPKHPGGQKMIRRRVETPPYSDKNIVMYDPCEMEPGRYDLTTLTATIACWIARHMGASVVKFIGFDSWWTGGSGEYAECVGSKSSDAGTPLRHQVQGFAIREECKHLELPFLIYGDHGRPVVEKNGNFCQI